MLLDFFTTKESDLCFQQKAKTSGLVKVPVQFKPRETPQAAAIFKYLLVPEYMNAYFRLIFFPNVFWAHCRVLKMYLALQKLCYMHEMFPGCV
jgi:hypothetical protein